MKLVTKNIIYIFVPIFLLCCNYKNKNQSKTMNKEEKPIMVVNKEKAIEVSKKDALMVYGDITMYDIKAKLENGNWIIDYILKNEQLVGGGPHYVISATTGEILEYRYEQ